MGNSDDDDDHAEYGTALQPIEEDEVARKRPIAVSEQIATDERGRRRFHGAFTGGFSAGYFNTVGSKEGWAPSTFKSSRSDRAGSSRSQNVLDFMDEEDKGAFGIAPQVLRPTDDFSDKNDSRERKRPWAKQSDGPIPGVPVLDQIIQPVKETVGIKILVKMGWRPGKGVGPKVDRHRQAKRAKISSEVLSTSEDMHEVATSETEGGTGKVYGCTLPPELMQQGESDSDDDIEEAKTLLAPDDVNSLLCNPKENTFGLGYKGLDRNTLTPATNQMDLFGTKLKFRVENKNLSISGQAFGVGAFEDNDDDIYSREDMSQYDFALETPEERRRRKALEVKKKRNDKSKENCIDGFRASSKSTSVKRKYFPPPPLPANFQPFHTVKTSRFEKSKIVDDEKQDAKAKGLVRHGLTIPERQVLIEDDVDKMPPPSNVDEASQKEMEPTPTPPQNTNQSKPTDQADIQRRIERLKKFTHVLQTYSSKSPEESERAAFKPFMKNPEKQERYEKYLTLRDAGFSECLKDLQPPELTEWERDREKMEFERASKLYKPMNSILSSRFVSAKSHDISHLEPEKELVKEKDPKDDPKVAAQMKLFGKLTHRVVEWHPDKLVCKRFNIPHPYPDSKFVGVKGDPSIWNKDAPLKATVENAPASKTAEIPRKKGLFDNLDFSKPPPGLLPQEAVNLASSTQSPMESSEEAGNISAPILEFQNEITRVSVVNKEEDIEAVERPPLDLFKEIFADSSDSETEDEEAETTESYQEKKNESPRHPISQHTIREKTAVARDDKPLDKMVSTNNDRKSLPPENESVNQQKGTQKRGVFDRIDLDRLQQDTAAHHRRSSNNMSPHHRRHNSEDDDDMEDVYGPAPPKSVSSLRPYQSGSSISAKSGSSTASSISMQQRTHKGMFDDTKKEVNSEEVMWVEKSALSDGNGSSKSHTKSKKHSSKKSRRKSSKKEKRKSHSHRSKRHNKHKKKGRKHKSKSKRDSSSGGSGSSASDDNSSSSDGSSDSVTINDSLDNRALLAKLKQITRSN